MRSFYLLVAMAIMLPLCLISKPADGIDMFKEMPAQNIDISKFGVKSENVYSVKVKDAPAPQMAFKVLDTDLEYFWSTIFDGVTPFAYEPKSNTLVYVTTDRKRNGDWSDATIYFHFSQDGGKNWTKTAVFTMKERMLFFPSVAVLNPNNETDPEKFKYVVTVTPFIPRPTPNDTTYYASGNLYVFFNGQDGWDGAEYYAEEAPSKNNIGGAQKWDVTNKRMTAVSSEKGDHFYIYGMLNPVDGYQYGTYGLAYIDFTDDYPDPQSQIPEQWDFKVFRNPGGLKSSYNAPIRMSVDKEGNVYAFVFNMFNDNPDQRVPAFSKSTDNGKTWSEFKAMPFSVMSDFLLDWKHNLKFNYVPYPYTSWDAVVTGVDEFSVFVRLISFVGTDADNAVGTGHYAEASYKNNNWQAIKRIGELWATPLLISNVGDPIVKDSLQVNRRYNELEAAITADGKSLVVKYLDADKENSTAVLATPVALIGNPMAIIDTLNSTDIFVAYRNLDENEWKPVQNITKDLWYNKGTYMPPIVPSVTNIPVVEYLINEVTNQEYPRIIYPYFLLNLVGDKSTKSLGIPYYTAIVGIFDFNNPTPINNPTLQTPKGLVGMSVLEKLPFSLNNIAPNPANEYTSLSFNLEYDTFVTINLHNAMGQFVKTIFTGNAQQGYNDINVITNDLPSGAYFYTINVDGKSQTKLLNVIR